MHLSHGNLRRATAYADNPLRIRAIVRRDSTLTTQAIIGVAVVFGVFAIIGVLTWLRKRSDTRKRTKSRTQGYESSTATASTELATASSGLSAPQPAQTAGGTVDRHTSVRSVMTLPAYRAEASTTEQVLGRAGDRDGVDIIIDQPTEENEEALRDEELEALYQIRNLRRQQIEERERRRVERQEARARNDTAALDDIRIRSRIARDAVNASNEVINELRTDASRAQGRRLRSASTVSYGDLGVARHDGSRVRANSNDSERMGLLADAASIGEGGPTDARHGRHRSVSSFVSVESGPPSPAYPGSRASSRSGRRTAGNGRDSPLAGSSPDMVEVNLDLGDEDDQRPPPGYVEAPPAPTRDLTSTTTTPTPPLPPPEYTEGGNGSRRGSDPEGIQAPTATTRTQHSGSFVGTVPQIVIDPSTHH